MFASFSFYYFSSLSLPLPNLLPLELNSKQTKIFTFVVILPKCDEASMFCQVITFCIYFYFSLIPFSLMLDWENYISDVQTDTECSNIIKYKITSLWFTNAILT